ncbi:MAG: fused MFS/spermidine synthase [Gemmatimonadetes bacterium]|nr:fused MFS/spermidine synthase [Gemmatimonadota bacterium]
MPETEPRRATGVGRSTLINAPRPGRVTSLLRVCFVFSGGAALLYEVAWLRLLVLVFGTTSLAVATLLAAFMAGLGLGSYAFGRIVDRWGRPVLLYGLLELGVGAYALLVPTLFQALVPVYQWAWASFHPSGAAFSLLRFGLAFLALLLPTALMGGTLPILSRYFARSEEEAGFRVGLLYALNALGSAAGAFATAFFLLPALGLQRTILVGVAVNAAVGAIALLLAARTRALAVPAPAAPGAAASRPRAPATAWMRAVLAVFALSGFLAMAYEVAWTRLLTLVLGSSTYSFTLMVTTFILGIALGSAAMARPADRIASPVASFGVVQAGIGLATLLGLTLAHHLPSYFLSLFYWTGGRSPLFTLGQFSLSALVMLLPTLLMGAAFPVAVRALARGAAAVGSTVGKVYGANTVGGVLGAVGAGFWLLPRLGIQETILAALVVNLVAGGALIALAPGLGGRSRALLAGGSLAAVVLAVGGAPRWDRLVMSSGVYREAPTLLSLYGSPRGALRLLENYDLIYYREGTTATVTVVARPVLADRRHLALAIDGKVDASTAEDMATQVLSGHLPLMLAPRRERVLVIGWGSGVTVGSAALYPVRSLSAIEIEPAVVEGSRAFEHMNHRPLDDPRLRLVTDDARNYLLAARDTFDVIVSEPSNPWMSGPAKLFTREFFELAAERLTAKGVFAQWVQLYGLRPASFQALVRTFVGVFPHTYLVQTTEADLLLLGSRAPFALDARALARWLADPGIAADLARVGVRLPADVLARFRLGPGETAALAGAGALNTDDNGLIEFAAPRALYEQTIDQNLRLIEQAGNGVLPYLSASAGPRDAARLQLELGESLRAAGHAQESIAALRRAVELAPSPSAYTLLGNALSRAGSDPGSLEAWGHALRLDPHYLPARLARGRRLFERGDRAAAAAEFTLVTRAHPRSRTAWTLAALVAHAQQRPEAARAALARSEALAPEPGGELEELLRPYLAYRLAHAATSGGRDASRMLGDFVEGLRAWRQALHWEPANAESVDSLWSLVSRSFPRDPELRSLLEAEVLRPLTGFFSGLNHYVLGYYDRAVETLTTVQADAGRRLPLAHYYLGLAHWRSGNAAAAASALAQFLEEVPPARRRGPTSADARVRLEAALHAAGQTRRPAGPRPPGKARQARADPPGQLYAARLGNFYSSSPGTSRWGGRGRRQRSRARRPPRTPSTGGGATGPAGACSGRHRPADMPALTGRAPNS